MHPKRLRGTSKFNYNSEGKKNKIMKVGGFQDKWVEHLPWVKSIICNKGDVHEVHCAICSKQGKVKLFVPSSITC
jgi:hypothetical protein